MASRHEISRRRVLQGAGAALLGAAAPQLLARGPARPNILFILADDLGYADLSCYGRRDYRTPHLDGLAGNGLRMTQGYSNSPVCSATRIALITGRYQYRLRAGLEEPIVREDRTIGLPPGDPTLPAQLRRIGYSTALVGKWHIGWAPEHGPLRSGYDSFFGILPGAADYFTHSGDGVAVPKETSLYEGDRPVSKRGYLTSLFADRACEEIRKAVSAGTPFFISLHFNAPHWPWQGPADEGAPSWKEDLFHTDGGTMAKYAEMVTALDSAVGRVLAELAAAGVAEETIVVFTSDNGGERFSDTWPFRGEKTDLLEGGIRVPLIVSWPNRIRPGSAEGQVMISMDWLPTLLAAAGARPDRHAAPDGENLLPVLTGAQEPQERTLFWRYKNRDQAAARSGRWKYLKVGKEEALYDLASDPRERANLRAKEKVRFAALKESFERWNAAMLPYPEGSVSAGHA
ncbi:MAG TPA: sulfatase-like hydrolase/transferase [Allosphingosinicella sp.]|jgi:arylsulfatase A-like enzyme